MLQRQKWGQSNRERDSNKLSINGDGRLKGSNKSISSLSLFVHWQAKTSSKIDGFPLALTDASQLFMETVHFHGSPCVPHLRRQMVDCGEAKQIKHWPP